MPNAVNSWLGRVPSDDPFERRTAMAVQVFCFGLSTLLGVNVAIQLLRGLESTAPLVLFGVLADVLGAGFCLATLVWIRRGRIRGGYALMLGGFVAILTLSLVLRGLEYHQQLLPRALAILLVFAALLLGRRALWATVGLILAAMLVGHLRDLGWLGGHGPLAAPAPPLGRWGQAIAVMLLLCVVLDRFGAALAEAYTIALGRQREAERVSQQLRVAKESLESEMERRRRAETLLFQSQKLEAIGRLSGGVAHDFNNLLTAILGFTHISHDALSPEDPARDHLEGVLQAAQRGAGLTRQLLAFARKQIVEPRAIRMEDRVRAVEPMLRRLIGENVHIALVLAAEPQPVLIDPVQFDQVLMNLAVNARDAMPRGGTLRIETGRRSVPPGAEETATGLAPGEYLRMLVSDTGEGMDSRALANVFEPFFTTKEVGKGTGLGLATCYGILRQAGGTLSVTSAPGRGATFEILLPPATAVPVVEVVARRPAATTGSESILVVEDDAQVLELVARVLRDHGYTVSTAPDPAAAEAFVRSHAGELDLLLTDVVLPGVDGRRLSESLVRLRPNLATLYMSGHSDDIVARHGALEPGLVLLSKPFTPDVLLDKVREVLHGRRVPA
jgi:signal transduction histidine kinase